LSTSEKLIINGDTQMLANTYPNKIFSNDYYLISEATDAFLLPQNYLQP
jgi:hypothetical protein